MLERKVITKPWLEHLYNRDLKIISLDVYWRNLKTVAKQTSGGLGSQRQMREKRVVSSALWWLMNDEGWDSRDKLRPFVVSTRRTFISSLFWLLSGIYLSLHLKWFVLVNNFVYKKLLRFVSTKFCLELNYHNNFAR